MIFHKLIDKLKNNVQIAPGADIKDLAQLIVLFENSSTEKFSFESIPLELSQEVSPRGEPTYLIPKLTQVELQAIAEQLVDLPADSCWYEFKINQSVSCIYVFKMNTGEWAAMRFDYTEGKSAIYDGVWTLFDLDRSKDHLIRWEGLALIQEFI